MTDTLDALCAELETLTNAMETAMQTGDLGAFTRLVQGRDAMMHRCLARWEAASPDVRDAVAPRLQRVLETTDRLLQMGQEWLETSRRTLVAMQHGRMAIRRYVVPLPQHSI